MAKEIQLTQGYSTIVDDKYYNDLIKYKWHVSKNSNNDYYARRRYSNKLLNMHRIIMKLAGFNINGFIIDHINGNTLDNRIENLRLANKSQNTINSKISKHNTSGFKGVSWDKSTQKWVVRIKANNIQYNLGRFIDKIHAAKVYNEAALKYFGEFARLNKI